MKPERRGWGRLTRAEMGCGDHQTSAWEQQNNLGGSFWAAAPGRSKFPKPLRRGAGSLSVISAGAPKEPENDEPGSDRPGCGRSQKSEISILKSGSTSLSQREEKLVFCSDTRETGES